MNRFGAINELEKELNRYNVEAAALQEVRWPGVGVKECQDGYILYSGRRDGRHEEGTGFYIRKQHYSNILNFEALSSRLSKIRIKCKWFNLSCKAKAMAVIIKPKFLFLWMHK